jgi:diguanylate cyclase
MLKSYLWRMDDNYEKLKEMSNKDHLTGLNNARSFEDAMLAAFSKARKREEELSLLIIDIDHFKKVNDTYGHPVGDIVLKEVGYILQQTCRSVDSVSRNGGEEFSIIMPACDSSSVFRVAERLRKAIEGHSFMITGGVNLRITVSIGCATTNKYNNVVSTAEFIKQTDEGLYNAKQTGRNRISCSRPANTIA